MKKNRRLKKLAAVILGSLLMYLNGCVAINKVELISGHSKPFRSEDYIIYRLLPQDSPASLAQKFFGDSKKAWIIEDANEKHDFVTGQYIVIPLVLRGKGGISSEGVQSIPILCYHRFGNNCESPLCVSKDLFDQQMKFLKTNGYRVITPEDLLAYLEHRQLVPKNAVMITCDDGYRSFYTIAFPILKKYGFTATMFVYTDFVGVSDKAISWDELRDLKAHGFTIGSHTVAHSDLTKKDDNESDEAYKRRLRREIFNSKHLIDIKLNQETLFFAYPFGRANIESMSMVRQAGYKMAVTVQRGANPFFANPYMLRRDQVLKKDMNIFKSRLKTFYPLPLR
ncbi:MAG: polysaccharide deacetylase family protein [Desulfobacteraceae bacterium]|nr:polysaccharide deacetylase family protein [Desulfobacteraceae bacterium]